jgi:hypothetical protein
MRVSGWSGAASGGSIRRWYAAFPLVTTAKQIVRNWSRLPASWRISSGGSASAVEGRRGTSIHACCPSSSRTRYASRSDLENINLAETYVAPSTGYAVGCCQLSRLGKGEISHGIVGGWRSLSRSLAAKITIRIQFLHLRFCRLLPLSSRAPRWTVTATEKGNDVSASCKMPIGPRCPVGS